jgi:hypothetical protein
MHSKYKAFINIEIFNFQYLEPQHNRPISQFMTMSKAWFSESYPLKERGRFEGLRGGLCVTECLPDTFQ